MNSGPSGEEPVDALRRRVLAVAARSRANDLTAAAMAAVALLLISLLVAVALYWSGWTLFAAAVPAGVLAFRWLADSGFWAVARRLEQQHQALRGRLVAALQLAEGIGRPGREAYSRELMLAAVQRADVAIRHLDLSRAIRARRVVRSGLGFVLAALLALALGLLFPQRAMVGLLNAFAPDHLPVTFDVAPGDTTVSREAEVVLRCRVGPAGLFRQALLEMRGGGHARRRLNLNHDSCRFVVSDGAELRYRFRLLGRASSEFRIARLEPVVLQRIEFVFHFPEHTGLAPARSVAPEISVPRGTHVTFEGRASHELSAGRVLLGEESLPVSSDQNDRHVFSGSFTVLRDAEARLELAEAATFVQVAAFRLHAQPDEPPFVKLFAPGRNVDLPAEMRVLLGVNSIDDYGLGEVALHYGRESLGRRLLLKRPAGRREDTTLYVWDLSQSSLLPGDVMRYCVEVLDNDRISGPKAGRSEVFAVRFPTMAEIYDAAVNQSRRAAEELSAIPAQQSAVSQELARVSDELKRSRELSWDERHRLEQVVDQQEQLMQQLAKLSDDVARAAEELAQGMTFDPQTMEQLGKLQDLLAQLLPRELQEALRDLGQRLAQTSPRVNEQLERLRAAQDRLRPDIERALKLLERIMQEQRLEALARKAAELERAQAQLAEQLGRESDENSARRQDDIASGLDSLQQEMERLSEELALPDSGTPPDAPVAESLAALARELDREGTVQQARQLSNQLQSGDRRDEDRKSRQLQRRLADLARDLEALSQSMKTGRSAEVGRKLAASVTDLLALSERQEELEQLVRSAPDPTTVAGQQMAVADGTRVAAESLAALAAQTTAVPPGVGRELARAMAAMQGAATGMSLRGVPASRAAMADARAGLNLAVAQLLQAQAASQQGGGTMGGMEGLLQQLSEMARRQMDVNAGMGGIPIPVPMPGGLSPGQMEQLARMLAQQQELRQKLEQMLQGMGGQRPGLTASLERLIDEMAAVERDIAGANVTRQLVERQESILAHLLDAERSVRQQGFREERRSEAGRAFTVGVEPALPLDRGERNRRLREELMRALKQSNVPEYEELIRAYFERLLSEP